MKLKCKTLMQKAVSQLAEIFVLKLGYLLSSIKVHKRNISSQKNQAEMQNPDATRCQRANESLRFQEDGFMSHEYQFGVHFERRNI